MKTKPFLALFFLTLLFNLVKANTDSIGKATIHGNIIFEEIEGETYRPRSIILKQTWPIVAEPYFECMLDSNDYSFRFELNLAELTEFTLFLNFVPNIKFSSFTEKYLSTLNNNPVGSLQNGKPKFTILNLHNVIIERRDNLIISIDFLRTTKYNKPTIKLSGTGSINNNFNSKFHKSSYQNKNLSKLSLKKKLKYADKEFNLQKRKLINAKDSISEDYYNLQQINIIYKNINTKHNAIQDQIKIRDSKSIESKKLSRKYYAFMDTATFNEAFLISRNYRTFLYNYLEFIEPTRHNLFSYERLKDYHLAKSFYKKNNLKNFLFNKLRTDLGSSICHKEVLPFYFDFIKMFPSTVESAILKKIFTKHSKVRKGNIAPNILLIDSLNQTINLDELIGNVVFISFGNFYKKPFRIKEIKDKYTNTNVLMVSLNSKVRNKYPTQWSIYDYYIAPLAIDSNLAPYFFTGNGFECLVDTNGIIIDNNLSTYLNHIIDENQVRLNTYKPTPLERARENMDIIIGIFVVFISLIISIFLTYKSKLKRQKRAKQLTESELKAIRAQLNPHFLFNSLNSIQNFINSNSSEKANTHLSQFARLMRQTLELSNQNSITLHNEISFIKDYIELEQVRYEFTFSFEVDENIDLYNVEIPSLITQPFVENAIVHGMADLGTKGELQISIQQNSNYIVFEITDNGKGLPTNSNEGFGLKGCNDRINLVNSQNKNKIELDIESPVFEDSYGTKITLSIPEYY